MTKKTILAAALLAACAALANPICPSCGREASTEDAKVCAHCQTQLPRAGGAAAEEPAAPAGGKAAAEAPATFSGDGAAFDSLKAEYLTARRQEGLEKPAKPGAAAPAPHPNIAFFHYHNALALAPLARLEDERQQTALSEGVRRSLAAVTHWDETCPVCKGERTFVQTAPDVGQNTGRIGSRDYLKKKVTCPMCGGKGAMPGYRNYARMTRLLAEGRREFDTIHQAAGDRKVGYAWVPEQIAAGMDARARATVASSYGAPCPKCGWTGLEPCGAAGGMTGCKGEGVVKCKAPGCKNGWIESAPKPALGTGGTGRGSRTATQRQQQKEVRPCEKCNGTALVVCETCAGARLQPCKKCGGEGLSPLCAQCNGTGLVNCRKCSGSGRYTPPGLKQEEKDCPDCRGLGEISCTRCNGVGRRTGGF